VDIADADGERFSFHYSSPSGFGRDQKMTGEGRVASVNTPLVPVGQVGTKIPAENNLFFFPR
jgi:hypothetical protein